MPKISIKGEISQEAYDYFNWLYQRAGLSQHKIFEHLLLNDRANRAFTEGRTLLKDIYKTAQSNEDK